MIDKIMDFTIDKLQDNLLTIIEYPIKKILDLNQPYKQGDDLNKGVWIGTRGLQILNNIQYTPLIAHWCVKINGKLYSLQSDNGLSGKILITQTSDDKLYEWYYQSICQKTDEDIYILINYINHQQIQYGLLDQNCQYYSKIISKFANGDYDKLGDNFVIYDEKKYDIFKYRMQKVFTFQQLKNTDFQEFYQLNNITTFKQYQYQFQQNKKFQQKVLQQQKQYKEFEKQGFSLYGFKEPQMFQSPAILPLGQTNNQQLQTLGQTSQTPSQQIRNSIIYQYNLPQLFQNRNQLGQQNSLRSGSLFTPLFDLQGNRFQNSGFQGQDMTTQRIASSNMFDLQQQQRYLSGNQFDFDQPRKTKLQNQPFINTTQLIPPVYDYNDNEYTTQQDYEMIDE